ncbi:MAG TPA: alginate lyase family protein, partial [Blastocatellia bacterium]|nr:alginate lyase family protein [Blastocatellia bacterium]
ADLHWSEIGDFDHGDIKIIWEPSRFGFAYALVRAYWRTGYESYAELFWKAAEDWRDKNPPQLGPNWKCGQEISFRVMAWCFALYGFLESAASTAERFEMLAQMIAVSGCRIEANLDYALSQHNNHGISEAAGLFTIGGLFPELGAAARWKHMGREALEGQGRELIYDDGSFSQHSANYQRLMLHDYLWALRLADLHGEPFSEEVKQRVAKACEFLYQIQDGPSGRVPCYGQNDGSLILPLNNCDYDDFRPVIQAAHYLFSDRRSYESGPWDEDLLWMFGPDAVSAPVDDTARVDLRADVGGYYTLRCDTGFAFVRCASFRDRPGQADMLHVDLWWRGQNVALDPGSHSYNAPAPWDNPLAHTAYHNTVTVDDADQMERAGKFLWLPWLHGRVRCNKRSLAGHLAYWEGEHDGYERLKSPVSHRRGVLRIGEESWLILDRLTSRERHRYRLHWLLPDLPFAWDEGRGRLTLRTPVGDYVATMMSMGGDTFSLVRADETSPRGWRAPYYNDREPALSLAAEARAASHWFLTLFAPAPYEIFVRSSEATVSASSLTANLRFSTGDDSALLRLVSLSGTAPDNLELT